MTSHTDDADIAQERRLIGLFAEMRQAAKIESSTWGAAKHDIQYLRARIAENPALAVLVLRLFQVPPPVRSAPSLSHHAHGTERPTARGI
jgi:hypothetical protein